MKAIRILRKVLVCGVLVCLCFLFMGADGELTQGDENKTVDGDIILVDPNPTGAPVAAAAWHQSTLTVNGDVSITNYSSATGAMADDPTAGGTTTVTVTGDVTAAGTNPGSEYSSMIHGVVADASHDGTSVANVGGDVSATGGKNAIGAGAETKGSGNTATVTV
ncbi:MAG: hypothetical protein J5967_04600, partial [Oscillospiraceae bacterium]|nr:hypothetical protein [Oscillospiraceae bacterium]